MTDFNTTVDTYLEAYSEPDAGLRGPLLEKVFTPDAQLIDPPLDGKGHDGISAMIDTVLGQFPGHRFRRSTGVDAHHNLVRYGWELVAPDGAVALAGMDVGRVDDDGRLQIVTGWFGDPPPKDAA